MYTMIFRDDGTHPELPLGGSGKEKRLPFFILEAIVRRSLLDIAP